MNVFVDTGGFFSLLASNDVDHAQVVDVFRRANAERWVLVTTNAVVFETYALLLSRSRAGRSSAIKFLDVIESSQVELEHLSPQDEQQAMALVRAHADKSYSLCDAASFVVCKRRRIASAIALDSDFRAYGRFTLFP